MVSASILEFFSKFSQEITVSAIIAMVATIWFSVRAQQRWIKRSFFERVGVSLNYVVDGKLKIRTLQEQGCAEVFNNSSVVKQVMKAARKQKVEGILNLPEKEYWYFLNPVLNAISEQFATGFVREEAGLGAQSQTYLLFLTGGSGPNMRQGKVRAMLIREELLLETATLKPTFSNSFHELRWKTLQAARQEWVDSKGETARIRRISLAV